MRSRLAFPFLALLTLAACGPPEPVPRTDLAVSAAFAGTAAPNCAPFAGETPEEVFGRAARALLPFAAVTVRLCDGPRLPAEPTYDTAAVVRLAEALPRDGIRIVVIDDLFVLNGQRKVGMAGGHFEEHPGLIFLVRPVNDQGPGDPGLSAAFEALVAAHEFGHAFRLVNDGLPMKRRHEDQQFWGHCADDKCLMYWARNSSDVAPLVASGAAFDRDCLDDASAITDLEGLAGLPPRRLAASSLGSSPARPPLPSWELRVPAGSLH